MDTMTLATMVGGAIVEDAIPTAWLVPPSQRELHLEDEDLLGQFSLVRVSLEVARWLMDSSVTFFTITENGRLVWDVIAVVVPSLPWQWIRMVGLCGKEWHMDPVREAEQVQSWQLWLVRDGPCRA